LQGSRVGIILERSNGILTENSLKFAFKANNNKADYEALIAGMLLAKELGAHCFLAKNDLMLITGHVSGE